MMPMKSLLLSSALKTLIHRQRHVVVLYAVQRHRMTPPRAIFYFPFININKIMIANADLQFGCCFLQNRVLSHLPGTNAEVGTFAAFSPRSSSVGGGK